MAATCNAPLPPISRPWIPPPSNTAPPRPIICARHPGRVRLAAVRPLDGRSAVRAGAGLLRGRQRQAGRPGRRRRAAGGRLRHRAAAHAAVRAHAGAPGRRRAGADRHVRRTGIRRRHRRAGRRRAARAGRAGPGAHRLPDPGSVGRPARGPGQAAGALRCARALAGRAAGVLLGLRAGQRSAGRHAGVAVPLERRRNAAGTRRGLGRAWRIRLGRPPGQPRAGGRAGRAHAGPARLCIRDQSAGRGLDRRDGRLAGTRRGAADRLWLSAQRVLPSAARGRHADVPSAAPRAWRSLHRAGPAGHHRPRGLHRHGRRRAGGGAAGAGLYLAGAFPDERRPNGLLAQLDPRMRPPMRAPSRRCRSCCRKPRWASCSRCWRWAVASPRRCVASRAATGSASSEPGSATLAAARHAARRLDGASRS